MNVHTSIIAALALTGTLAGAPARAADEEQDARFEPTPSTCHALYRTVELERMMGQPGPGATFEQLTQAGRIRELPFWTFSNARHISFHQRQRALENSAGFDPEARPAVSITMPFRAGFPQGQPADGGGVIAPSRAATPAYCRWGAQCDEAHSFTPGVWLG
ncbi:MAG: hypothetical protein JJU18_13845 [Oceanicaulis sp.]|nr:hypothetical protein [Oceanicaulis sp.]